MALTPMQFNPVTGLLDTTAYVAGPATETDARTQVQGRLNELRDYLNSTLLAAIADVTDGASGADNTGMTAITETGAAATVQSIMEALITRLKAVTNSASGADLLGMTVITETGANATVQSVIEALITRIKAVTDSASGADLVGATAITDWAGATVQAILESAKTIVDGKFTTADASATVKGIVELATNAEMTTGTDTTRAITPANAKVELDKKALASSLTAHIDSTSTAHGAASAATAYRLILRDVSGRAKVAAPAAADDLAILSTTTDHAAVKASDSVLAHVKIGAAGAVDANGVYTPSGFKTIRFTRDTTINNGTQAITGIGFVPRAVILLAITPGVAGSMSIGLDTVVDEQSLYDDNANTAGGYNSSSSKSIFLNQTTQIGYGGLLTSLDADGFTITWTRTGNATGTAYITALAIR